MLFASARSGHASQAGSACVCTGMRVVDLSGSSGHLLLHLAPFVETAQGEGAAVHLSAANPENREGWPLVPPSRI